MMPILDEKQKSCLSGIIASKLGSGGVSFVSSITGQSRYTIVAGADRSDSPCGPDDISSKSKQPDADLSAKQTKELLKNNYSNY